MNHRSFASIYALILAKTYEYSPLDDHQINNPYETGDIDMIALWCILSAGWFAVVPFLSWSSTLRRIHARRPIFTYWTFLIAVGGTCAGIKLNGGRPYKVYWATAAAICTKNFNQHQDPAELYLSSWFAWSSNSCTSQCGSLDPGLSLRAGTPMVPIIQTELPYIHLPVINDRPSLGLLTAYASPVVFIQWFYACWSGRRTASEARDQICIKLCEGKSSYQRKLTVSIAMCVYTFACASLTICPLLFVFNIVFNEMNMLYLPQDEPLTAVGQWSQCVIALILVIAALINQYHDCWSQKIKNAWKIGTNRIFMHRSRVCLDPGDLERSKDRKCTLLQLTARLASCKLHVERKAVVKRLTDPVRLAWLDARLEWLDFCRWIRNPVEVSQSNADRRKQAKSHGRHYEPSEQTAYAMSVFPADSKTGFIHVLCRPRSRSL